ncbi:MAG: aminoacyl-tRNA hydrolase [SAR324 cluster bacterium]|uniref:Aminoacyl-tRNA hydrolase n=1 Tax=SAR324 cluster bacterium TaxID=2024889 RepID=A0A7X9IK07_9DELT|nr:aminoacyl-tRNA hydrolase [SAR324 cluster bacterium]
MSVFKTDIQRNSDSLLLDLDLDCTFDKGSGPGGQNRNKRKTRARLRWNFADSRLLTDQQKNTLRDAARKAGRLIDESTIEFVAEDYRTQGGNRDAAIRRLHEFVGAALKKRKKRKKTSVPSSQKKQRLEIKRYRAKIKKERQNRVDD